MPQGNVTRIIPWPVIELCSSQSMSVLCTGLSMFLGIIIMFSIFAERAEIFPVVLEVVEGVGGS
jgi:hypothetical protein